MSERKEPEIGEGKKDEAVFSDFFNLIAADRLTFSCFWSNLFLWVLFFDQELFYILDFCFIVTIRVFGFMEHLIYS